MTLKKASIFFITFVLIKQLLLLLVSGIFTSFKNYFTEDKNFNNIKFILTNILIPIISIAIIFFIITKLTEKDDLQDYMIQFKEKINPLILLICIILPFLILPLSFSIQTGVNKILTLINYNTQSTVDDIIPKNQNDIFYNFLFFTSVALIAPLTEELSYRSILAKGAKQISGINSLVLISLIFAFAHGGIQQFFPQFILSLFITYVYFKTNTIYLPILMHVLNNSFVCMIIFLKTDLNNNIFYACTPLIFLAIYLCVLLSKISRKNIDKTKYIDDYFVYTKKEYSKLSKLLKKDKIEILAFAFIFLIYLLIWIILTKNNFKK